MQNRLAASQRCPEQFEALIGQVKSLHYDFQEFEKGCKSKSEVCTFFGVWLQLVAIIKNAVASDRDGNCNLHAATVEDSMQIFEECDCINYLRHGLWYLEQIKVHTSRALPTLLYGPVGWSASPRLVMCSWRGHEGRADYPASI